MSLGDSFTTAGLTKFAVFASLMVLSGFVGVLVEPNWVLEEITLDVHEDNFGNLYYISEGEQILISPVPAEESVLQEETVRAHRGDLEITEQYTYETELIDGEETTIYEKRTAKRHWGFWSLLPALCAVLLCWITREPITALLGGILSGALILTAYDITGEVLIPTLSTTRVAGILILYLWLLGGLMGVWSRTGAAQAFAELMTRKIVRGPRTAKFVAWSLGVIFFPRRHGQHSVGRNDGKTHRRPGTREPRGTRLHRRFDGITNCVADCVQRMARICAGIHLRCRCPIPRNRSGPHRVFLSERAVLFLRDSGSAGYIPAQH